MQLDPFLSLPIELDRFSHQDPDYRKRSTDSTRKPSTDTVQRRSLREGFSLALRFQKHAGSGKYSTGADVVMFLAGLSPLSPIFKKKMALSHRRYGTYGSVGGQSDLGIEHDTRSNPYLTFQLSPSVPPSLSRNSMICFALSTASTRVHVRPILS